MQRYRTNRLSDAPAMGSLLDLLPVCLIIRIPFYYGTMRTKTYYGTDDHWIIGPRGDSPII